MNHISLVSQAVAQNSTPKYSKKQHNVNFTGNLGDKFIRQIIDGQNLDTKSVLAEAKGTFGLKAEKVEDILDSFIYKIRELFTENSDIRGALRQANAKIDSFPSEKQQALNEMQSRFTKTIIEKDNTIAEKNAEILKMKEDVNKYSAVVKVKSVDELDTIMPDKLSELLNEFVENNIPARKSMFEFLMTGKGQEEALKQIERNNQILKAQQDGTFDVIGDFFDMRVKIANKTGEWFSSDSSFVITMIQNALISHKNGAFVNNNVMKKQIKDNAMAILTPMANDRYSNTTLEAIERSLDKALEYAGNFHKRFSKGLENLRNQLPDAEIDLHHVDFDPINSYVTIKFKDGSTKQIDCQNIAISS